ncbi:MAG: glycosyltransferase [Lentisphaerae bacterium]|nr:glycosyltransferase [Lentisphaerota bacterium]
MTARLRLLMITSDLAGGGAEREFANLLRHLDRERFDLHLALWRRRADYPLPDDVPLHVLGKTRPWHLVRTVRRTARLVDALRPDVVLSFLQYPNLVTGTALGRSRHRPRWICRFMNPPGIALPGFKKLWARRVLKRADLVLGCSEALTRAYVAYLTLPPDTARTIPNPVDLDRIREQAEAPLTVARPPDAFVIAHAGRLHPQKNQALLFRALAALCRPDPSSRNLKPETRNLLLWLLGRGPLEKRLRRLARRLGIADRIRWLGFQANPFPFVRNADAFVLSSNWEGAPNALIEAMACGTPVIATRCPYGPGELIADGRTGLLVPPNDPAALAAALRRLIDEPGLRAALGGNARRAVAGAFALPRVLAAYTDALAEGRPPYRRARPALRAPRRGGPVQRGRAALAIGLISREYPWRVPCGGVGVSTAALARALGEAGHRVTVFTQAPGPEPRRVTEGNVRVIGLAFRPAPELPDRLAGFSVLVVRAWSRLVAERLSGPDGRALDIVEAPDAAAEAFDLLRLRRRPPVVVRIRGGTSLYLKTLGRLRWFHVPVYRRERACVGSADAVAVLSNASRRENAAHYRLDLSRAALLANPVDTERFRPADRGADGPCTVLFVGRLDAVKGFDRMPAIMAAVWARAPETRFVFAGRGESPETALAGLPADRRRRVTLLGPVPYARMPDVYRQADLLVAPSRTDALPRSCSEAAACGVPAVGARDTGMADLVRDGATGFLEDAADPTRFAVRLLELIRDPDRRAGFARAARADAVRRFGFAAVAETTAAFYRSVLSP